jgi:hypothetical protein
MVRNLLEVLAPKNSVQHVALVTGLETLSRPFETYAQEGFYLKPREEHPRLKLDNFYYAQNEIAAATRDGFTWSIHRSHRCWASRWKLNEYGNNFGSLRKYMQRKGTPFIWPGSKHSGMAYLM